MLRDIGNLFTWLSIGLLVVGYIWSFIIAWRCHKGIFFVVLFFWIVGYPLLLATYWKESRMSLIAVGAGVVTVAIAFWLLYITNPYREDASVTRLLSQPVAYVETPGLQPICS